MSEKGYVKTPKKVIEHMVSRLFENKPPKSTDRILDAGCGQGEFIEGIILWCKRNNNPIPKIIGVESNKELAFFSKKKFEDNPVVTIEERDFLTTPDSKYQYIIANPPYVSILKISEEKKIIYKSLFETAIGRFDLYLLFFEKSLKLLEENGRLVFITPEKYVYVETAKPLRKMLTEMQVKEIEFLKENAFKGLVTYATVTIAENSIPSTDTIIKYRDGSKKYVSLPKNGERWQHVLNGKTVTEMIHTLEDICTRISCGVATGADEIFVRETETLTENLKKFAYPTISGRELTHQKDVLVSHFSMLTPYDNEGKLLAFEKLGDFGAYLSQPQIMKRLKERTCCKKKPWYAFHENPPMNDIMLSKILCKDITDKPDFWLDREGCIVPRHSVYYIVPKDADRINELFEYLKSDLAKDWLLKNSQRATNNFIRLQSHVLKKLPIPETLYSS